MSEQAIGGIVAVLIIVSRVLSHFEHKKTNDKITIMLNGDLDKRIKKIVDDSLKENKDA